MRLNKWLKIEREADLLKAKVGNKGFKIKREDFRLSLCVENMLRVSKEAVINNPSGTRYYVKVLKNELRAIANIADLIDTRNEFHKLIMFSAIDRELISIDYLRINEQVTEVYW